MADETVQEHPKTFLEKVDESFDFMKDWLVKDFGDHMSIHNAVSNAKAEILSHVADHFGIPSGSVEKKEGESDTQAV